MRVYVNNLIVVSDLHMICRLGLCPPDGVDLDDGGRYLPSRLQKIVWGWWEEFWGEWVPMVTRGEPYAVCVNGDAVDGGAHHNNTTHISDNHEDQKRLALKVLRPVAARATHYYHIRGTEAHAGTSGVDEESLARELGAIPDEDGKYAPWNLRMRLGGPEGALVDLTHHIGVAGSTAYESSALTRELSEAYVEASRWGEPPPDVVGRSHRHRNSEVRIQTAHGFATVFTTAGWQLKTPLCHRVAGARQAEPQIGGSLIRHGDHDNYTRHFIKHLARPRVVTPEVRP
jgi:hypothetical protein